MFHFLYKTPEIFPGGNRSVTLVVNELKKECNLTIWNIGHAIIMKFGSYNITLKHNFIYNASSF